MADLAQAVLGFFLGIHRAPPIKRLVLCVALAERKSDLGLGEFRAEIERVRAIRFYAELGIEGEGIARNMMPVAVEDMNAILGRCDSKIRVPHLRRYCGDFLCGGRIGRKIVEREKPRVIAFGQGANRGGREHEAPRGIVLFDSTPRMRAYLD